MDCNTTKAPAAIFESKEDCKAGWDKAKAEFDNTDEHLVILGKPVMERWETPYMQLLADIAASKGGRVLEVGFGLGIAATQLEKYTLAEHVIVECNEEVFQRLLKFSQDAPNKVTPMQGLWEDVIPKLEDNSFDAILYDTFPLSEDTWHIHQFDFINAHASRLLKPGGILTYCNLTSWGEYMKKNFHDIEEMFSKTQIPNLVKAGFLEDKITWKLLDIKPEKGCRYYEHNKMIAPIITKS